MDPALLNYLQSQQSMGQNPQGGSPQGQAMQGTMPQGQAPYNPFDSGIRKALDSARESLGMTEKQQDKALRQSVLAFAANNAQQPKQRGFFNNFGSATRSLVPALQAYDQEEDTALTQNNAMANQILAYKTAEEKKVADAEYNDWYKKHAENQLAEQSRAHDMTAAYQQQKLRNQKPASMVINGKEYSVMNDKERLKAEEKKQALGATLKELNVADKKYDAFRKKYESNYFDPQGGYSSLVNPTKNLLGRFVGAKKLREETVDRENIEKEYKKIIFKAEQEMNKGKMAVSTFNELKKYHPNINEDLPEAFDTNRKALRESIESKYKTYDYGLQHGINVNPLDLEELENSTPGQENNNQELVIMQDANGMQYEIPANEANDALNDGLTPIE